jgi:hypothetical protein
MQSLEPEFNETFELQEVDMPLQLPLKIEAKQRVYIEVKHCCVSFSGRCLIGTTQMKKMTKPMCKSCK